MRKVLLTIVTWIICLWAVAGNVTPEEALQQATQFLQEKAARQGGHRNAAVAPQLEAVGVVSNLYVFNVANDKGFIIVANDDRAFPILGYSNSGTLDLQNIPDNMRAWLQGYADEIAWVQQHDDGTLNGVLSEKHRTAKAAIAPMITSRWSQGDPYNKLCPDYQSGKRSVTGCVATAMAQVMNYRKWPAETTAAIPSYTSSSYSVSVSGIPAATPIDWANILDIYANGYSDAEATAIAELMHYCGVAVKMNYGPSSGAHTHSVAHALKDYFNYKETTTYVNRSFYSYDDWIDMMYHELSQGRPIVYGGQSSLEGHEFVIDGYDSEDYFHINWGWGGLSDDYFKLSALDSNRPGIGGSTSTEGYHFNQDAVIGIQKPSESGTLLNKEVNTISLSATDVSFGDICSQSEDMEINITVQNYNTERDYDGDIGIRVTPPNNSQFDVGDTFIIPAGQTKICKLTFAPEQSGTYYIRPYCPSTVEGKISWISYGYNVYVGSAIEADNTVTLDCEYHIDDSVEDENEDIYKFYGKNFIGSVTYTNNTDDNYRGNICVYISDLDNSTSIGYSVKEYTIRAHSSLNIPIAAYNLTYGNRYQLVTYYKRNGISRYTRSGELICCRYGTPHVVWYDADGHPQATELYGTFDVPTEALSVNLVDLDVEEVTPNANPNCLYVLGTGDALPTGLTNSNVIRYDGTDYTAESISLTDGNSFYSPIEFTAENIEFTYSFTIGANGTGGWNTIILPFDVVSVTADDVPIDWFKRDRQYGKQFWLKKFTGEGTSGNVIFGHETSDIMHADTPYIIALPGSQWGDQYDLSNKTIKFIGENNSIISPSRASSVIAEGNYRFVGQTYTAEAGSFYALNAAGSGFELVTGGSSDAFRAYFKAEILNNAVHALSIGSDNTNATTAITDINMLSPVGDGCYYNLNGQRVETPRHGIYVKDGKKIFVK